jgi:hypothetical protein
VRETNPEKRACVVDLKADLLKRANVLANSFQISLDTIMNEALTDWLYKHER